MVGEEWTEWKPRREQRRLMPDVEGHAAPRMARTGEGATTYTRPQQMSRSLLGQKRDKLVFYPELAQVDLQIG